MMIEFIHLSIKNFRSWKRLDIDLSGQGVVCIKGATGAGKTSLFSALYWGLYGRLPEDIKADEIRNSRKPAEVRIVLRRENQEYIITRYRGHLEYKSKVFFQGLGIPLVVEDSYVKTVQGLISNFLGVSETVFLTTTYFAQRNFHRFHSLTDTHKKAFIESLTYGSLFEACENTTREKVRNNERELDKLDGQLIGLQESLKNIQAYTKEHRKKDKEEIQQYREKIQSIDAHIVKLQKDLNKYKHFAEEINAISDSMETDQDKILSFQEDIKRYSLPMAPCPRCGLTMLESLKKERIYEAQQSIKKLELHYERLAEKYKKMAAGHEKYRTTQTWIADKEHDKYLLQSNIKAIRSRYNNQDASDGLREQCEEIIAKTTILRKKLIYTSFWMKGFSFQGLRSYVLINTIRYLSKKIEKYLHRVMDERIEFHIGLENNRLVTECNGRSYACLSGGERQAVDLCTGLAMRDLAEQYNKSQFNILVLDEPFEGLDKNLTAIAQSLLLEYAKPSTFLITHQDFISNVDQLYHVSKKKYSHLRKVY